MESHEIEVKNGKGKKLIVSIEMFEANAGELKPTMDDKEAKAHCEAYHKAKSAAVKKLDEENKVKMERETLKNKSL